MISRGKDKVWKRALFQSKYLIVYYTGNTAFSFFLLTLFNSFHKCYWVVVSVVFETRMCTQTSHILLCFMLVPVCSITLLTCNLWKDCHCAIEKWNQQKDFLGGADDDAVFFFKCPEVDRGPCILCFKWLLRKFNEQGIHMQHNTVNWTIYWHVYWCLNIN